MWIKRTVRTIIFCIVFVVLFNHVYKVLSWKDTAGDYYSSLHSFYELEDDLVDVLFLGSSHCYCAINNSILWDEHGIASFSLSISGQDLASTYHCLVEGLKTQTPEVVMIELYGAVFDGYRDEGNLYRNTIQYKLSQNAFEAVDHLVTEGRKADYWLRWPIIHTRYAELKKEDFQDLPVYIGYQSEFHTESISEIVPYKGEAVESLGENREYWLLKIIELAKETGTSICFFVAPYTALDYEQMCYKRAEEIASENNVPFINMIDLSSELGMNINEDFSDWMHTNHYGAEKVTRYIGEYLKHNYELDNHYGDDQYRLWDEDLLVRQHEMINRQIQTTGDVKEYLKMLGILEDYTVVVVTSGEYLREEINLKPSLRKANIGDEFYDSSHVWIYQKQELIYTSGEEEAFYHLDLGQEDLIVSSSQGKKSVVIDRRDYCVSENGINILIYDNVLKRVVDAVGFDAGNGYALMR